MDRLSLQRLEYEMDRNDYHVNYNCFEIGYCGHPKFFNENVQFNQGPTSINVSGRKPSIH